MKRFNIEKIIWSLVQFDLKMIAFKNKVKAFTFQLIELMKSSKYPSTYVWGYWSHTFENGNVKYSNWKTLMNFITNKNKKKIKNFN